MASAISKEVYVFFPARSNNLTIVEIHQLIKIHLWIQFYNEQLQAQQERHF